MLGRAHHANKIYDELGCESLDLRRWSRRLVLFYKMINHLTPDFKRSPIPYRQESNYSLRRRAAILQIRVRTERFKSTFYPNCFSEWEKLDPEIRESRDGVEDKEHLLLLCRAYDIYRRDLLDSVFFWWVMLRKGHGGLYKAPKKEERRKRAAKRIER